jgi:hypothetical protein
MYSLFIDKNYTMKKITLKSTEDSYFSLFIYGIGIMTGGIIEFIFSPVLLIISPARQLAYKLDRSNKFEYWRKIKRTGNIITVSAHYGHTEKPEYVQVYSFDVANATYEEYRSTDNGKENHIKGTLKVGIKKFT